MVTARRRRTAMTDDLVNAILQASGRLLPYRPDWWVTLIRWHYFRLPPPGAERVDSMSPPFDARAQLDAWRSDQIAHELQHRAPCPVDGDG